MSRTAKPWFRRARAQWYATVNGVQVPLGVLDPNDEAAALQALRHLLAKAQHQQPQAPPPPVDWAARVAQFVTAKAARGLAAQTIAGYEKHLGSFARHFAGVRPDELFVREPGKDAASAPRVEESAHRPGWGENYRRNYLVCAETFLNWCGFRVKLDKPGRESAGEGTVIPEDVYSRALALARGDLRPLLCFLWNTGCRPNEATRLAAADVNWAAGTITLRKHKTQKGSKGRARVIYLSPAAAEVLVAQRERHPAGLLFPNRAGGAWRTPALTQAVWRVARKIGHRVTAYGCRHSYATRALEKGLPDTHVAALLGHGSTRMIHKHYSHVNENARLLKDAAAKV